MPGWTDIPSTDVTPENPIKGSTGAALRDNPVAIAQRDEGAPPMAPPTIETFTSSGTWTRPEGVVKVRVRMVGSGAGGAGGYGGPNVGGPGGGGGAYAEATVDVSGVETWDVTVGASGSGGGGGDTTAGDGGDGDPSIFGHAGEAEVVKAEGGNGGVGGSLSNRAGGDGGSIAGSTGDVVANGGDGDLSVSQQGGAGGSSMFAGATRPVLDSAGRTGSPYGGGGSGGSGAGALGDDGGDGRVGIVIIEY